MLLLLPPATCPTSHPHPTYLFNTSGRHLARCLDRWAFLPSHTHSYYSGTLFVVLYHDTGLPTHSFHAVNILRPPTLQAASKHEHSACPTRSLHSNCVEEEKREEDYRRHGVRDLEGGLPTPLTQWQCLPAWTCLPHMPCGNACLTFSIPAFSMGSSVAILWDHLPTFQH